MKYHPMIHLKRFLIFLILLPLAGFSQTRTDSIAGMYHRKIVSTVGSVISISDQNLILDKNHCAALTIKNTGGTMGFVLSNTLMINPQVYYGMWKISGDSVIITYTKTCCSPYTYCWSCNELVKMDPSVQNKYFWTGDNNLEPLTETDKTIFYKGELELLE